MASSLDPIAKADPTRVRYLMLALVALAPASAYLTRIISVFNTTIATEFQISDEAIGDVIRGFALGYFVFQVPGGMLANAYGVRLVLPTMAVAWALCGVWGSAAQSADQLYYSRLVMGIAQAGLVPCCAKVVVDWFPLNRRGIVSAVLSGSMQGGAIIATSVSAILLESVGWRNLLLRYAVFGIAWAFVFFVWFRNRPYDHPATNEEEQALIRESRTDHEPAIRTGQPVSWAAVVPLVITMSVSVSLWAYFIQATFRAYSYELFLSWFPAYLEKAGGLEKADAGELATWPIVGYGIGSLAGGAVVDWILVRTGNRWLSRCGSAILGLTVSAVCFGLAAVSNNPYFVVAILTVGTLFAALGGPATWASGMDLGGRHTAVVFGIMNMFGNVGSYLCPLHVGMLFDYVQAGSGSWDTILWLFVGINVAGAATWILVDPRRPALQASA